MDTSFIYRYKGIIFDLDGTLTDSMPFHVRAWQQVAKEHGFGIKDEEIYRLGGSSSKDIAKFFKDRGENVGDIDEFVKRKIYVYTQNIDKVELFPKIADILVQAKKKGLKIAIGTGTRVPNATYILKRKFDSQVSRKIAKVLMYFIFLSKICYQYIVVMSVMCYYISILNFRGLDYALICFQN